jgi:signal transduction histidine kinase
MADHGIVAPGVPEILAPRGLDDPRADGAALAGLRVIFGAEEGRIYALELSSGKYVSRGHGPRGRDIYFDARGLTARPDGGALEQAVVTRSPSVSVRSSESGARRAQLVIPVLREETVVGLVDLRAGDAGAFRAWRGRKLSEEALAITRQLANTYEARSIHRILEQTAEFKVDLYKDEATALRNLMNFVGTSSGMQYAVLRQLESPDVLRCVQTYGFPPFADEALSFRNFSKNYRPFAEVVRTRSHWRAPTLKGEEYRALVAQPELADVRSFVACPVLLGTAIWGVLSFAAAIEYEYSDLEIYSLRALANLAGVALDAAQLADRAAELQFDDGRLMQATLANEVVVATRHSMSDQLEIVGGARSSLLEIIVPLTDRNRGTRLTRKDIDYLKFQAESLDIAHAEMNKIMDTIRVSQRELLPEANKVVVGEVWQRAKESFSFRINRARLSRVDCDLSPHVAITGSEDWLRIVFMHLLLNSLDAFDRPFAKGRRDIVLRLEERRADQIRFRYHDTAGGIIPRELVRRGTPLTEKTDVRKVVFERFVSSKEKGTGLGLASCRAALETMSGSIELIDWRKGITFDILLNEWTGD